MRWLVSIALALLIPGSGLAAAWTQAPGGLYVKAWNRSLVAPSMFTADGDLVDLPELFQDHSLNVYAEYGLTEHLTLVAFGNPVGYASYGDEQTTYTGLLAGGLRYGLAVGQTRWALELHYGYTPDPADDALAAGVVDEEAFVISPTVGHQRVDAELQVGRPWSKGWWVASAGYRWLSEDALDPVVYGFGQVGWQLNTAWQIDLHFNLLQPLGDVELTNVAGAGQTRYAAMGSSLSWWFNKAWALNGSLEGVFYAESNAGTPSVTFGVEHRH